MFRSTVMGRTGSDVEVRATASGAPLATVNIATDQFSNGAKETVWVRTVAFGGMATRLQAVKKGQRVLIEGEHRVRTWKDKDQNERTTHEVVASNIQYIDFAAKVEEPAAEGEAGADSQTPDTPPENMP